MRSTSRLQTAARPMAAALYALLLPAALTGCFVFGDDKHGDKISDTSEDTCAKFSAGCQETSSDEPADMKPPAKPFRTELAGLISQPVRWAGLDVTVNGARVERGLDGDLQAVNPVSRAALGLAPPVLDPNQTYAVLDLELSNKGHDEVDYGTRATWDLVLADGTRLTSVDALGVTVLPSDTAQTSLHYEVADAIDLRGATLELNGKDRDSLEPEVIPLDQRYQQQFPRSIPSLMGRSVIFVSDDSGTAQVDAAVYDVNYAREDRAPLGKRFVWLRLAISSSPEGLATSEFDTGDLRIIVDGRASSPVRSDNEVLDPGTTKVLQAAFAIDELATRFDLMIPDGSAAGQRFPVETADTVLATDLP